MRKYEITRKTKETDVSLSLNLDGSGSGIIDTGSAFFDHMLTLFASHGGFDLNLKCVGDVDVDFHHSAEDIGICLGRAILQSLGDLRGINRYGSMLLPMDEALILCALDISGRATLRFNIDFPTEKVGEFDTELVKEFFLALTREAKMTIHLRMLDGENSHHIAEGAFKAFARALKAAVAIDAANADKIPSSKGTLL